MSNELFDFIERHHDYVEENIHWGALNFRVRSFLSSTLPPTKFVTSIRAIVLRQGRILVVRDPEMTHIIPGGKCEPDENWNQTLSREIAEETGWRIHNSSLLGVRHFHHLTPIPVNYKYPYPDFCQIIYRTEAIEYDVSLLDPKRYELEADFQSPAEIQNLQLTRCEKHFLNALHH
ncbi:MAG TPA: NUDIX hydrolase [Acidobacteriota bacterium]|jgi:ADP-ribose pyrophosphatase YjhB (NUDIX family)